MINCLRCELLRAKAKAIALSALGWEPGAIAAKLSDDYGERYYIEFKGNEHGNGWLRGLYRASKLPPHTPHLIKEFDK
uniref:Uncharacterized protein n=1 Tax=Pseudomonas phage Pavpe01 TaxID=3138545 RepID=A0AAU6W0P8_9VIRU